MRLSDRLRVELIRASARFSVDYGRPLRFAGSDLAAPTRVSVPTRHGKVGVFVYRPLPAEAAPLPVHVHFHGGAFLMRHPAMDDWWCRYVAATAGVAVANVDFEVAPRAAYPVAQHQAHDAAAWLVGHGDSLGLDGSRLSVGGFSSVEDWPPRSASRPAMPAASCRPCRCSACPPSTSRPSHATATRA
ncbi:alpha/beta hydrolase [Nocardioides sp. InS609-2]|uniref:alpha/beta hydrolase fold domain-containing protein n=1 Tax=Nocardioides sp. InS609-2 TaxID=2760705 RepID=UPI0024A7563D|nr:alpha/beta hydrolase [Nocardioides sp. InS609-2]